MIKHQDKSGFTLVELAIVIVIIGLLIAGVFSGQELIKQSKIRSTISKINSYNTAVMTFKVKYGGSELPGDFAKSSQFGLDVDKDGNNNVAANSSLTSNPRGDKILAPYNYTDFSAEYANFWVHLSNAWLIKDTFSQISGCTTNCYASAGTGFPKTSIGFGMLAVTINSPTNSSLKGVNYLLGTGTESVIHLSGSYDSGDQDGFIGDNLTIEEARTLDSKIDDEKPLSGKVQAVGPYGYGDLPPYGLVGVFLSGQNRADLIRCYCQSDTSKYFVSTSACGASVTYTTEEKACTLSIKSGF